MLRIAACDDCSEDRALLGEQLKMYFLDAPFSYTLSMRESGRDFLKHYIAFSYDIVFLDVEMPGENGIEIAKEIRRIDSSVIIIFLTSHKKYVFSSFLAEPLQYLVKPLRYKDLDETMALAEGRVKKNREEYYLINHNNTTINLPLKQILYFESKGRIVNAYTSSECYPFYAKLNDVEKELCDRNYLRAHQSYLINMQYITRISATAILLNTGKELPVSRSKKNAIHDKFWAYLGGLM